MSQRCEPADVATKSFFLGPQAENGPWVQALATEVLQSIFAWRRHLHPEDGRAISVRDVGSPQFQARRARAEAALRELLARFEDELPKFSPRYVGHMFSEISLPALFGHLVALLHNPNNISGESSRVGTQLEDEAVRALLAAVGLRTGHGHFTSGGTVANLEALIRARARLASWLAAGAQRRFAHGTQLGLFEAAHQGWRRFGAPPAAALRRWNFADQGPWQATAALAQVFDEPFRGPVLLVPQHHHYSWTKGASLLGLGDEALWHIELDATGKLSVAHLSQLLERAQREARPVLMVVSVAGTTELGAVDPIDEVQALLDTWRAKRGLHLWHHVDAAYGGLLCTLDKQGTSPLSVETTRALRALRRADSITLDPHKLGYVPFASGALLVRRGADDQTRSFGGPYLQFDPSRDKGPFTLEGSRSAAGAVATWLTARTIGLNADGYGRILGRTVRIKQRLEHRLRALGGPLRVVPHAESNILGIFIARDGQRLSEANAATERAFEALAPGAGGPFIVSRTELSTTRYGAYLDAVLGQLGMVRDTDALVLLRLCMMNPFFDSKEMNVDFERELLSTLRGLAGDAPLRRAVSR
ncbi:MAG: hypothetical protein JST54_01810 [Deltaproteobacteria bacterium]|nr:hypothetical protein [Deltaproteobacteria bacterium]